MAIRRGIPNFLIWLFWILVALALILIAAVIIHHFGGFNLQFNLGHFHAGIGVS
jgi:hypothetical protein